MGDMADYHLENFELPEFDEYAELREIKEMYDAGMSVSAIAAKLDLTFDDVLDTLAFLKRSPIR